MQQLERVTETKTGREDALRAALRGWQTGIWTALPAIVQSYNAENNTVEVQPAIKGKLTAQDGSVKDINMPLLVDCPVLWPSGGGFLLTFPIAQNDEGLVVFASRCIDAWWQSGGIQTQGELRLHDLSDGFFLPGCFSKPNVPANINTTQPELRNHDGSVKLTMTDTGFAITGDLTVTQGVTAGQGGADQVTLQGHVHTSAAAGHPTSAPTAGT
jgi:hypothetical protein